MESVDRNFNDALPIGTRIGSSVLGGALGQGGEGLVYLGEHPEFGSVVVKEFWPKQIVSRSDHGNVSPAQSNWQSAYKTGLKNFIASSRRLCELPPHPNVVDALEVVEANGTAYLVMRHLVGTALSSRLESGTSMGREQVGRLAADLCSGLAHLHGHGLVHRDVSPDNIIMVQDRAVLIDLNAAKDEARQVSLSLGNLVKAGYSPFEQYLESSTTLDARSDIYAASAVLIHAITGHKPAPASNRMADRTVPGHTLGTLPIASYPPRFIKAIEHGFALSPGDRPGSIDEWRRELDLPRLVDWNGQPNPRQGSRQRSALFGGLALAGLGAAGLAMWHFGFTESCAAGSEQTATTPCAQVDASPSTASAQASDGAEVALAASDDASPAETGNSAPGPNLSQESKRTVPTGEPGKGSPSPSAKDMAAAADATASAVDPTCEGRTLVFSIARSNLAISENDNRALRKIAKDYQVCGNITMVIEGGTNGGDELRQEYDVYLLVRKVLMDGGVKAFSKGSGVTSAKGVQHPSTIRVIVTTW